MKITLTLCLAVLAQTAFASTTFVSTRSGLSGSDSFFMSTIGADGTTITSGSSFSTTSSNTITISDAGTNGFSVLQEGVDWSGDFTLNDLVLWTGNVNTLGSDAVAVTLTFGTAVGGVGMQIGAGPFGPFTASITAFDALSTNLGSFSEAGNETTAEDNSSPFLGVLSTSANIKSIVINIIIPAGVDDFAFNELTFGAPSSSSVPEPSSLALILCGAGLFTAIGWKRRHRVL